MTTQLTRRQALQIALAGGLGGLAAACSPRTLPTSAPVQPTRSPATPTTVAQNNSTAGTASTAAPDDSPTTQPALSTQTLVASITPAALAFLNALDDNQRTKATYTFTDSERLRWHWTTPANFPRNGLPLREMSQPQHDLAMALLQASVSKNGFQKALDIISLQNSLGNDPDLYYVTVFGTPGSAAPWGWRFEGHHLSRHFTLVGDQLAVMPFFLGAWPTVTDNGLKAMEREEWAARELITSLEGSQRQTALFQDHALGGHVTQNQPYVTPLDPVGLQASEFNETQQALMFEIVHDYLNTLPDTLAASHIAEVRSAGLETIRFGWAGSLEPRHTHYYRLQGPTFLLEFDNSRNGGTHIHSVWRDFAEDFGQQII